MGNASKRKEIVRIQTNVEWDKNVYKIFVLINAVMLNVEISKFVYKDHARIQYVMGKNVLLVHIVKKMYVYLILVLFVHNKRIIQLLDAQNREVILRLATDYHKFLQDLLLDYVV